MKFIKHYILIISLIAFSNQTLLAQNRQIDSLLKLFKTDKEDTTKVLHLISISKEYHMIGNLDNSLSNGSLANVLAQKLGYKRGISNSYNMIGRVYYSQGNYLEALKSHFKALNIQEENKDKLGIAKTYNNIGNTYQMQGKFDEAIKNHFTALKFSEEIKYDEGIAFANMNIGNDYYNLGNYTEAIKKQFIALNMFKKLNNKSSIASLYSNIGFLYLAQSNYTEALNNLNTALKLQEELKDELNVANTYNTIGLLYSKQQNNPEAAKNYQASLNISERIGAKNLMINSILGLGNLLMNEKKLEEAELNFTKALALSKEIGSPYFINASYIYLTRIDSSKKDYKAAFEHYKLSISYRDSLTNIETQKNSLKTTMEYEFEKKEIATKFESDKIVSDLETQNKLQNQKQLFLVIFIIVFIILVLVALFFAKRAYDNKKKYSEVLSKENEHKELLLREVHHRVNNSLQMISSLLSIQADTTTNEEIREYLLKSENRIQAMSTMHHLLHMGNSKLEVNINQYLGEIINFYSKILETKPNIKLHVEIPSIDFHTKTALPLALLLNELLTNSIKYAFPNDEGNINIILTQVKDSTQWLLKISDNGVGFKEGDIGSKGTSLGLNLVKLMSRQIGGQLNVNHENGTSFELLFNVINSNG